MAQPQENLERRVVEKPCARVRDCMRKTLGTAAEGALDTYGIAMMTVLCPPVMLYCAGKCAVHGIQRGYRWAHEHWDTRHQAHV